MQQYSREEQRLLDRYDTASGKIKSVKSTAVDETTFGIAYQNLVKAGLAQQIKRKYRKA